MRQPAVFAQLLEDVAGMVPLQSDPISDKLMDEASRDMQLHGITITPEVKLFTLKAMFMKLFILAVAYIKLLLALKLLIPQLPDNYLYSSSLTITYI